ncbi:hypothetical protein HG535_0G04470 [Zygotorulaspora mrakii]|uniref:Structural maintenance of chromosomes protein n=1 Tax=Zygotorulaspora mrakii TaxID=42260 RepID=A0A7H9B8I3_ZYGMR|nr:uncharacterized protein HG535_0G04470 [Zygotorulaspora mrakii]QLG74564.1 hypothetical protein HG535_0G04470 [Zygotorulaspora mrakii]
MSGNPFNKRQKIPSNEEDIEIGLATIVKQRASPSPTASSSSLSAGSFVRSRTPRKLLVGQTDGQSVQSQPTNSSSSLQAPSLQPPDSSSRGRENRTYSQSPPRSPGRSPARKLELIQLSPVKKTRLELQKIHDSQQQLTQKAAGRLCIDRLILNNFKSYAGEQVVGPFHSSFSAVVGPNGSGKSNVIDSMLFVFGFRASKMRQDRLADLIHKSEEHPNLTSCSVEVHFHYVIDEDGKSKEKDDKPKLIITRKAFRNNSSKYYINGNESNYTDVTKLLKAEGIDLDHKRFLILQGEVENIAQMKPKAEKEGDDGLLEYLEDIIGTSQYKSLIETNSATIESLNEICIEKENRFHIVDRERQSLESDKNDALEYLLKEKRLTLLKSKLLQHSIYQNNTKLSSTLDKYNKIKAELDHEGEKYAARSKEVETIKVQSRDITITLQKYETEEKDLLNKKRSLDAENVSMEEKIKNIKRKKKQIEQLLESSNRSMNRSQINLDELLEEKKQNEKSLHSLTDDLGAERAKLEDIKLSLKDKTIDISAKISEYEKELEPWSEKLEEKKAQIQLVESEISLMEESQMKLNTEIDTLIKEIGRNNEEQESRRERVDTLHQEKKIITKDLSNGELECSNARKRLKEMQHVLFSHRQRAIDARAALSTAENKSKVLTALTKLQKSGRINGFHGRLGDLGVIDKKYDIAISTACPRLEDIVVESVECGQHCIEYLRKNKLGYARFILLDKLRKLDANQIETPESVPRLFDLVEPNEEKFIPAFYSVLRNTLVSKDLAQANRVAYGKKKYRVVTLDGKLIDISGTMSGGGNHASRGLMKLRQMQTISSEIYTQEEVIELEEALLERENNFKVTGDTFHQMEEALDSLRAREPEIDLSISQLMMDIDSWDNELQLKKDQLSERRKANESLKAGRNDSSQVELRLKRLKEEQKSLEEQTKSKITNIKILKEQIMKIGGSELQIQNSKVNSIQERIELLNTKQKKDKSAQRKAETEIKKLTKTLETSKRDLDSYIEQIKTLDEKAELNIDALQRIQDSIEGFENLKQDLNDKLQSISTQLIEMEEDLMKFKSLKLEMVDKMDKLSSLASHIKKEIQKSEEEIDNLKIRDVSQILQVLIEQEAKENMADPSKRAQNEIFELMEHALKAEEGIEEKEDSENKEHEANEEGEQLDKDQMCVDQKYDAMENGLTRIPQKELESLDLEVLKAEMGQLQDYVDHASANIEILEEYARRLADYQLRKLDLNDAVEKRDGMRQKLDELKKKRFEEFMHGFGIISMTLKEMYQMITMGGNAELELVDSLDPFSEGVTFSVMPPKKSWRNITNLSGGEKTLSSLALVFALHKYKPTPLYVMDEIDAALDFRNVSIVANYIKQRTKNAQFIVISLRNNMFELAQQLVGIYKRDNMTKSATLKNVDVLKSSS